MRLLKNRAHKSGFPYPCGSFSALSMWYEDIYINNSACVNATRPRAIPMCLHKFEKGLMLSLRDGVMIRIVDFSHSSGSVAFQAWSHNTLMITQPENTIAKFTFNKAIYQFSTCTNNKTVYN